MEARITLHSGGEVHPGKLTDEHFAARPDQPLVILDHSPSVALGPMSLASDHLIVVHGDQEGLWDLIHAAVEAGFTVTWEGSRSEPAGESEGA